MKPYAIKWKYDQFDEENVMHVDLDHIVSITEPKFIDQMGSGGYFAEFRIAFMFRDKPTTITVECRGEWSDAQRRYRGPKLVDGVPEGVARLHPVFKSLYDAWCSR